MEQKIGIIELWFNYSIQFTWWEKMKVKQGKLSTVDVSTRNMFEFIKASV